MAKIVKVRKRDGTLEKFDPKKVSNAISKTLVQSHHKNGQLAKKLTQEVLSIVEKRHKGKIVDVQHIKETIEFVLVENKLPKAAKCYILFRYV